MDKKLVSRRKAIISLVLSLFLFFGAFLVEAFYHKMITPEFQTNRFQRQLIEIEKEVDDLLGQMIVLSLESGKDPSFQYLYEKTGEFDRENITLCLFIDDRLHFWSDNNIPLQPAFTLNPFSGSPVNIANGLFDLRVQSEGNLTAVGLVRIKTSYPYENEHLSSGYADYLSLPDEVGVQLQSTGTDIHDREGQFLFGLDFSRQRVLPGYIQHALALSFLIAFLLFAVALYYAYKLLDLYFKKPILMIAGFTVDLLLIRFLILYFRFPDYIYHSSLFSPGLFASSWWAPSLGDLVLNLFTLFAISYAFFHALPLRSRDEKKQNALLIRLNWIGVAGIFVFFAWVVHRIEGIVIDSSISFNLADVTSISMFSILGFICFVLLLFAFVLFTFKPAFVFFRNHSGPWFRILFLWTLFIVFPLLFFYILAIPVIAWAFLVLYFLVIAYIEQSRARNIRFTATLLLILVFSAFSTFMLNRSVSEKEISRRSILAQELLKQRDLFLEYAFEDSIPVIQRDTFLLSILDNFSDADGATIDLAVDYVYQTYFSRYSENADVFISICGPETELDLGDNTPNCYDFFYTAIEEYGEETRSDGLYYIRNIQSEDNYIGMIPLPLADSEVIVFVEFFDKFISRGIGYPELLVDQKERSDIKLTDYAYGRYEHGNRINQYGGFLYPISLSQYNLPDTHLYTFVQDGFHHLYYRYDDTDAIILSKKEESVLDAIAPFSYISIFLGLMTLIFLLLFRGPAGFRIKSFGLRNRLQLTVIGIIVFSFLVIGIGSVFYIVSINHNKNIGILQEKTKSVLIELEHKLADKPELSDENEGEVENYLLKFSKVFFTDINMYDVNGLLLATSRNEIFQRGLVSKMIHSEAYLHLHSHQKPMYIHEETIGDYSYLSAYIPFRNNESNLIAYMNLPYFAKQDELTKEISDFLVAFINVYVLLIAFSIYLALVISNYITKPIELLRTKIGQLKLGTKEEKIEWKRDDEIGSLVEQYNRKVDELAQSAELLAKSERESAWREMAKQIAHEIKNPLTPMKLSVQYLKKAWDEKAPDWDDRLKQFSQTIIEQINSLSIIASEFSDFAKMPRSHFERIDLNGIIENSIGIFRETSAIAIEFNPTQPHYVNADKEQLLRVFNNLIKNAIQAISDPEKGWINIRIHTEENQHLIQVADNGKGIPRSMQEKVFYPNFTTKSGGMGLGLALVKNIIENSGGSIAFKSVESEGTTFFITLPKAE